jgi:hypothetical protein
MEGNNRLYASHRNTPRGGSGTGGRGAGNGPVHGEDIGGGRGSGTEGSDAENGPVHVDDIAED